jgi:hypothetical protein
MNVEANRGTGRTTALMLRAIADSISTQGPVWFTDHERHTCERAKLHRHRS